MVEGKVIERVHVSVADGGVCLWVLSEIIYIR